MIGTKSPTSSGFTLLETVVALGIFSVFIVVITSIFSHFSYSQKRDIAEQNLQEDARLALEIMNREIRTGYGSTYRNPNDDRSMLSFVNQTGQCVFYALLTTTDGRGSLQRAESGSPSEGCPDPSESAYRSLTGPQTDITSLIFMVTPADFSADLRQGFVTTNLEMISTDKIETPLRLQTTTTSRQITTYEGF